MGRSCPIGASRNGCSSRNPAKQAQERDSILATAAPVLACDGGAVMSGIGREMTERHIVSSNGDAVSLELDLARDMG